MSKKLEELVIDRLKWHRGKTSFSKLVNNGTNDFKDIAKKEREAQLKSDDFEAVSTFLSQFDDDAMYSMFGDHCKVTVPLTGVEVEEYNHD